jgi:mannose-6-phosphate isomerase class I
LIRSGGWFREEIIIGAAQTEFFSFTELTVNGSISILNTGYPQVAIALKGEGVLNFGDDGEMKIKQGDEIFLPYDVPGIRITGDITLILCHPEGVVYK